MDLKCRVVVALLFVFAACDAKFNPNEGEPSRNLPRLALPKLPTCSACVLTPSAPSQDLLEALKGFGPTMKKVITNYSAVFSTNITNLNDMQEYIRKNLQEVKDVLLPLYGKVSAAAAAYLPSCPAFKSVLDNYITNMDALLTDYMQYWPTFVKGVDAASVLDAFRKTLAHAVPKLLTVLSNIIYDAIQVPESPICPVIGPVFNLVFDVNGIVVQTITNFLSNGGSVAKTVLELFVGSVIPGRMQGGILDQFEISKRVFCGLFGVVFLNEDLSDITGGYCPKTGSPGRSFDPLKEILSIFCAFLDVIDPNGSDGSCVSGSSGGGNPSQQGGLGGLLCELLNLLGLGGILGLCLGGSSTSMVDKFVGVICRVMKVLGGISLPICPIG